MKKSKDIGNRRLIPAPVVGQKLSVHPRHVYRLVDQQLIPSGIKVGGAQVG